MWEPVEMSLGYHTSRVLHPPTPTPAVLRINRIQMYQETAPCSDHNTVCSLPLVCLDINVQPSANLCWDIHGEFTCRVKVRQLP